MTSLTQQTYTNKSENCVHMLSHNLWWFVGTFLQHSSLHSTVAHSLSQFGEHMDKFTSKYYCHYRSIHLFPSLLITTLFLLLCNPVLSLLPFFFLPSFLSLSLSFCMHSCKCIYCVTSTCNTTHLQAYLHSAHYVITLKAKAPLCILSSSTDLFQCGYIAIAIYVRTSPRLCRLSRTNNFERNRQSVYNS